MPQETILLIILAAVTAIFLAWFQYFFKRKHAAKYLWFLTALRAGGIFTILLLLINPKVLTTSYYSEKPNLLIAVDNSSSIKHFGDSSTVTELVSRLSGDQKIRDRFNVELFSFGNELNRTDSLAFTDTQTNLQSALKDLNAIYRNTTSPTILISDGNQTFGGNYQVQARTFEHPILPVIVGDTTRYQDLAITRIHSNRYAFLNNKFPVELFLNYTGNESVTTQLLIKRGNTTLSQQTINFNPSENSQVIKALLPAETIGLATYQAQLTPLSEEKNSGNNTHGFAVEVIDERSTVLLVSSVIHPDLGALKRSIESNQQREVKIVNVSELPVRLEEFNLVILFNPTGQMSGLWETLEREDINHWVITGPGTDWSLVNRMQKYFQKEITPQPEEFFPELNPNFSSFQLEDIGYSRFPPLSGSFGELEMNEQAEVLLFQQVQGISTNAPLLAVVDESGARKAFLFGTDLWKWRTHVFTEEGSFTSFDELIGKLVQYLASGQNRERLTLQYENVYYGNSPIILAAQYFDENYSFDPRAKLTLELTNTEDQEKQLIPMNLTGNNFQVNLGILPAATYSFRVKVEGENLSASGSFTLLDFDIEQQFTSANLQGFQQVADEKGTKLYFPEDIERMIEGLLSDNNYATVQKSRINHVSLIDWYFLLAITLFFFSVEWFLRKYHGLI